MTCIILGHENSLSTAKHPADCMSTLAAGIVSFFISSWDPTARSRRYVKCDRRDGTRYTIRLVSTLRPPLYLLIRPFHPSIFLSVISSDLLPNHNQEVLKAQAESFISIRRSPFLYRQHHLWTRLCVFNPAANATSGWPSRSDLSGWSCLCFQTAVLLMRR